ncbi:MAG: hypothetical protein AB1664_22395 [Thermodesulfobacteriota bacterium]
MPISSHMVIFDRTYEIKDISPLQSSEGILGQSAYRDAVIYLDKSVDLSLSLRTLWHEAVHVAQQDLSTAVDEAEARWIALFVHNLLAANPWLAGCYLDELDTVPFDIDSE